MSRVIRYQGVVIRDDHILLVKHREHATGRSYWIIPGGGREDNETEEACVQREILEETHLVVTIERLLFDEAAPAGGYRRRKTYLCNVGIGEALPGYEPETEAAQRYAITEVGWFDLRHPASWDDQIKTDSITYPLLQKIQAILDYPIERVS
jgi:ADP-ribose pyrophosphatase YjhB (NUDIX family)